MLFLSSGRSTHSSGLTSEELHSALSEFSVGVAGVGGLGSNAAVALARAGVGRLVLVDFDRVEESNLSRQYYFREHIGMLKVEALRDVIKRINKKVKVEVYPLRLERGFMEAPFTDVDVVMEALDRASVKTAFIEEILEKLPGIPLVAASGVAGFGNPDRITTFRAGKLFLCLDENAPSCDEAPLTAPHVALMAAWEADMVLEILLGCGKRYVDSEDRTQRLKL